MFTEYGDLRLTEGGSDSDGALEFDTGDRDWTPICKSGFDNDAGDVACKQLGYKQSSDLTTYEVIRYNFRLCMILGHEALMF